MINRHLALFLIFLTLLIGAIVYTTPIAIPDGFPFAATAANSGQLNKSSHSLNVRFVDSTLAKGLDFVHQQGGEHLAGIDESLGSGVCAADFNNDNWIDLFLVNGSGHTRYYGKEYWWQTSQGNALFFNENGQNFKNVASESGVDKKFWGMGCLAADLDNDGDVDLLVTGKENNLLYRNDGNGKFSDITRDSGFIGGFWSTSAAAADFNRDGLLDVYVGNFIDFQKGTKTFEANSQFSGEKRNTFDASLYPAQANKLYLNLGALKFKDVTAETGVIDSDGRTLDVIWQDINRDNLPDLLIANDRGTGSNTSYINKGGKTFESGGQALGVRSALGNRGIASGDLDNDGDVDLVMASSIGENTVALFNQQSSDGKTYYKDRARDVGIGADRYLNLSAWTPIVQDFNNDGHNDVFLAAGHLEPDPDAARVAQGQSKQLLLNNGDGSYSDATTFSGMGLLDSQAARGVAAADFDNDGDVDLYVSHNNDLGQYLVNETPRQHWIGLKLIGTKSNKDAIGAQVHLVSAQGSQIKTVVSGEGFLSDSDKRLVFGLGDQTAIERLVVKWPSGLEQTVEAPSIERYWVIREGLDEPINLFDTPLPKVDQRRLNLKLGIENADVRVRYLKMLSSAEPDAQIWRELAVALEDGDPKVRREAMAIASRFKSAQGLNILVRGLEDGDTDNVLAALSGLKAYEDETSVRWLLRLFSHHTPAVKIALADCFSYFFQEEEAVVHRKYLAVPHLIRLLDDSVSEVRVAAARALANAERYRGIHALQDHLNDPDPNARAEVVRSLGLIRQVQALPKLKILLEDQSQPSSVIANAFIALKRIGDENALKLLNSYVMGQDDFQTIPLEKRLEVFADILAQENDASVFDVDKLREMAHAVFDKDLSKSTNASNWIKIWGSLQDDGGEYWLDQQTRSPQSELRLLAFNALSNRPQAQYLSRAWADQNMMIKQWALKKLLNEKRALSVEDYRTIINNQELRTAALQIWYEMGFHDQPSKLIDALLNQHQPDSVSQAFDSSAMTIKKSPDWQNVRVDELNIICFFGNQELQDFCPLVLFAENSAQHRDAALKVLHDQTLPLAIRQSVLKNYGVDFDPDAINGLYALTQSKKDGLQKAALQKLFSFDADSLLDLADKVANDASEDVDTRFEAIDFLVRRGRSEAREILYR